ncbi:stathmin-3 isoform X1 [Mesoplodon densirostris]|uniref:stathmin-3 isoform X1 n=1 Tax=Mesoplodon densirostris TaxID=48708 RepID=UPI0028DC5FE5|nr:stathmin-3 isoform X1 [Mesoplodon densirostris]
MSFEAAPAGRQVHLHLDVLPWERGWACRRGRRKTDLDREGPLGSGGQVPCHWPALGTPCAVVLFGTGFADAPGGPILIALWSLSPLPCALCSGQKMLPHCSWPQGFQKPMGTLLVTSQSQAREHGWGPTEPVCGPPSGCEMDAPPALSMSDSSGGVRSFLQHKMGACKPAAGGGPGVGTMPTVEADLVSSLLSKARPVGTRLHRALLGDLDVRMPGMKCLDFYPPQVAGAVMSSASLHAVGATPGIGNLRPGAAGHRLFLACGRSTRVSASPSVCLSLWDTSHWIRDPQSNTTSLFN